MKKTLVALSVAAFAAASANAAVVYNQDGTKLEVSGSARVVLDKTTDQRVDLNNDGSRVKFAFSQDLGEGLSALGYVELRPDFNGGINTKRLYAGLAQADIGTLTFGKQVTAFDGFKLASPAEKGLDVFGYKKIHDYVAVNTDGNKVVRFASKDFSGFSFATSYTFAQNADDSLDNTNEYQLQAKYEQDFDGLGFKAHAIYGQNKFEYNEKDDQGKVTKTVKGLVQKTWGLATKVEYAGFGLGVDYANTQVKDHDFKAKAFAVAATYQVSEPVDVYVSYTNAKLGEENIKGISLGSHYQVAKNVQTYVEYDTVKAKDGDRVNSVYTGLRVFF